MEEFDSIERAEAYFVEKYDDGTFSISIVDATDTQSVSDAYRQHFICCAYDSEEITIQGKPFLAVFDYGH